MNEELQKTLSTYLTRLLEVVEKGAEWAGDQIPLVIQEKLAYDFWSAAAWTTLSIVLIPLIVYFWYKINKHEDWDEDCVGPTSIAGVPIFLALIAIFCCNLPIMLKIWIAPRLYILEWVRTLV